MTSPTDDLPANRRAAVRRHQVRNGLAIDEVAREAQLAPSTVRRCMSGETNDLKTVRALAQAIGMDPVVFDELPTAADADRAPA